MLKVLEDLIKTIRDRKNSTPDKSYTNKLLKDKNLCVSKVKEEVAELIDTGEKDPSKAEIQVKEMCEKLLVNQIIEDFKIKKAE